MAHPYTNQPGYVTHSYSQATTPSSSANQSSFTSPVQHGSQLPTSPSSITNSAKYLEPEVTPANSTGPSRRQRRSARSVIPKVATKKKSEPSSTNQDVLVEPQATASSESYTPPRLYHFKAYDNVPSLSLDTGVLPAGNQYTYGSSDAVTHAPLPTPGPIASSTQELGPYGEPLTYETAKSSTAGKRGGKDVFRSGGNNAKGPESSAVYFGRGSASEAGVHMAERAGLNISRARDTSHAPLYSAFSAHPRDLSCYSPTAESERSVNDGSWPESGPSSPLAISLNDSPSLYSPTTYNAPHKMPQQEVPSNGASDTSTVPGSRRRSSTASFAGQFAGLEFDDGERSPTIGYSNKNNMQSNVNGAILLGSATRMGNANGSQPNGQTGLASTDRPSLSYLQTTPQVSASHAHGNDKHQQHLASIGALVRVRNGDLSSTSQLHHRSPSVTQSPYIPPEMTSYTGVNVNKGGQVAPHHENAASTTPLEYPLAEVHESIVMSSAVLPQAYEPSPIVAGRTMREHIMQGPVAYNPSAIKEPRSKTTESRGPRMPHISGSVNGSWPGSQEPQYSTQHQVELFMRYNAVSQAHHTSQSAPTRPGYQLSSHATTEVNAIERLNAVYQKRREAVKGIKKFWPTVFDEHAELEPHLQYRDDLQALSHLTDFWLERDPKEPRAFTAEFYFSENPYFSDAVLKKEFKYELVESEGVLPSTAKDVDGMSEAMFAFDWNENIKPQTIKISWKSDDKNLTKLNPRKVEDDDEDDIIDPGSFFNFFEHADDPHDFGPLFSEDLFPEAIDYFHGRGPNSKRAGGEPEEEEGSEDDDSGVEEIDLERPKKKAVMRVFRAVSNGANMLAEGFLFAVAAGLIIAETWRSSRSGAKRRDAVDDQLEELQERVKAMTEQVNSAQRTVEEQLEEIRTSQENVARVLDHIVQIGFRDALAGLRGTPLRTPVLALPARSDVNTPDSSSSPSPTPFDLEDVSSQSDNS
ncbi:hypothetical protein FRB98_004198 [Tulasnella sp. 332]|nr:hypothetical protein FRB98_004198 [Tulasnella sp. 332]